MTKSGLWSFAGWFAVLLAARAAAQEPVREPEVITQAEPEPVFTAAVPPEPGLASADASAQLGDLTLSAGELAALGIDEGNEGVDLGLKLSGFADVGFGGLLASKDSYWRASGAASPEPAFYVGNVNLYVTKFLTPTIRSMLEVRLSLLPNGSSMYGFTEPQSTEAFDYTDFGRVTRWGSIVMQRAHVEWLPHALLTIRIGQFLTPYGVWNVDHGSPVVIPVRRPWSIGMGWIPERQTGIEIFGRSEVSTLSTFGYHLTLSNGTGRVSEYADLDKNKALGGRLYWEFRGWGWLRLGASVYFGRHTDATYTPVIGSNGETTSHETITTQFDSLAWAADATWLLGSLHVQSEWITSQRAYTTRGRAAVQSLGQLLLPMDTFSWSGYVLVGYRLPWFGIMPFVMGERMVGELEHRRMDVYDAQGGFNIRPTDALVFKVSLEHVFSQTQLSSVSSLMGQVAWAF